MRTPLPPPLPGSTALAVALAAGSALAMIAFMHLALAAWGHPAAAQPARRFMLSPFGRRTRTLYRWGAPLLVVMALFELLAALWALTEAAPP